MGETRQHYCLSTVSDVRKKKIELTPILCAAMLCYVMLCYAMLCEAQISAQKVVSNAFFDLLYLPPLAQRLLCAHIFSIVVALFHNLLISVFFLPRFFFVSKCCCFLTMPLVLQQQRQSATMLIATIYDNCKLKIQQKFFKAQSDISTDCRLPTANSTAKLGANGCGWVPCQLSVHALQPCVGSNGHAADSCGTDIRLYCQRTCSLAVYPRLVCISVKNGERKWQ